MTNRLTSHPWEDLGFGEIAELERKICETDIEEVVFGVCNPPSNDSGRRLIASLTAMPFHGYFPTGITWWITSNLPDLSKAYSSIQRDNPVTYLDIDLESEHGRDIISGYADLGAKTISQIGILHGNLSHLHSRTLVGTVAARRGLSFPGAVVNVGSRMT